MIAENDPSLQSASATLYKLNADEIVRQQCRAREDYYQLENTHIRSIKLLEEELAEKNASLAEKDASLAEKDASLAEKDASLAEKDASLAEQAAFLAEKDALIQALEEKLKKYEA